jgi:hypothetical protein
MPQPCVFLPKGAIIMRSFSANMILLSCCIPALGQETTKTFTYTKTKQADLEIVVHYPPGWKESDKRPGIVFFFGGGWENGTINAFMPQAAALTKPLDLPPAEVDFFHVFVGHRDVVAEVGHVPIKGRCVRHDAEGIGVNFEVAADIFESHAFATGVGHDEMDGWDEPHIPSRVAPA